jgi:hypothetical protein
MGFFRTVAAAAGLSALLWGSLAYAQCTKDTECKGDRICRSGACEDPVPAAPANPPGMGQPVAPAMVAPETPSAASTPQSSPEMPLFPDANAEQPTQVDDLAASDGVEEPAASHGFSIYGEMAGLVSFQSWLGDSREDAGYGFFVAGYWGRNPLFHVGAFFHYYQAHGYLDDTALSRYRYGYVPTHNTPHLSTGVSLKIGGHASDRIWIGGVIDLGVHQAFGSDSRSGAHFFPRIEVDAQVTRSGRFKLGLFASFGPMLAPGLGDYVYDGEASLVSLQALAGLMFGA